MSNQKLETNIKNIKQNNERHRTDETQKSNVITAQQVIIIEHLETRTR